MKIVKKILSIFLRVGISILLLIFLFRRVDTHSVFGIIKNAARLKLVFAFLVFFSAYILAILRWEILLKGAQIHLPFKRIIISFAGGVFFNLFMPSTIGGDLVRSIDLAAHTRKTKEVVATVLLDRLSGYLGLVIVAIIAALLGWHYILYQSVLLSLGIIIFLLVVILLVLFNTSIYARLNKLLTNSRTAGHRKEASLKERIKEIIKNLHHEIHVFRHKKRIIVNNLMLSVIIQITTPLTFYIIALALGLKIPLLYFFIFLPIITAITLLPISIGGLGLRDATTIFFFAKAGVSKDLAFAMSLVNFSFILICAGLGGLIYVLTVHHRRLQHNPQPSLQRQL